CCRMHARRTALVVIATIGLATALSPSVASAATRPKPPKPVTAVAQSNSVIRVLWTDPNADETGYVVQRKGKIGAYATVATLPANTTSFTNTGLFASTIYYYRVRAMRGSTASSWSTPAHATTEPADTVPPSTPTAVHAAAGTCTSVDIAWNAASD